MPVRRAHARARTRTLTVIRSAPLRAAPPAPPHTAAHPAPPPRSNVCCDHHKAGLAKAKDRRSFGEVVTNNEAYNVQSFETVLPQRRAGV